MIDGPYVVAAMFCDQVIEGKDAVLSAIRIVDQQTHVAAGPDVPHQMPPVVIKATALIMLKAGETRGRYTLRIRPEDPSGQAMPHLDVPVNFTGSPEQGMNVVLPMQLQLVEEGLYWFDVLWIDGLSEDADGRRLTRMPLRVVYQPQPGLSPGAA